MNVLRSFLPIFVAATLSLGLAHEKPLIYSFQKNALSGPETLELNGFQPFTFQNGSNAELDVTVYRLREGATVAKLEVADRAVSESFSQPTADTTAVFKGILELADVIGGTHLLPSTSGLAYLDLEPGAYLITAATGGGPGDPYKPAYLPLTVRAGERAEAPTADVTLTLSDFHFALPKKLESGNQLWKISNSGAEPHLTLIFKLQRGSTTKDVTTWMNDQSGPPPFDFGTLVQAVTAGQTFYAEVELSPGTYAAVCPLPDLASGAPHFTEGMVSTFTVE